MKWPLLLVGLLVLLTLAGGREATAALAGIHSGAGSVLLGISYALLWFIVVLAVPVWVIAHAVRLLSLVPSYRDRGHCTGETPVVQRVPAGSGSRWHSADGL